jgi:hypothetical protein
MLSAAKSRQDKAWSMEHGAKKKGMLSEVNRITMHREGMAPAKRNPREVALPGTYRDLLTLEIGLPNSHSKFKNVFLMRQIEIYFIFPNI